MEIKKMNKILTIKSNSFLEIIGMDLYFPKITISL